MEALSSLANTPVPTLLVVAGVFFLFVALGGRFGAQIVTEKVNPRNALITGLLFTVLGVGLFSVGDPGRVREHRSLSGPDPAIEGSGASSARPAHLMSATVCPRETYRIPNGSCDQPDGNYIVVNIRSDDVDHGLQVRDRPDLGGVALGALPANATNLKVGECKSSSEGSAWCYVECNGKNKMIGWVRNRYLSLRSSTLYTLNSTDISINMRNGPSIACAVASSIPSDAHDIVLHICEKSSDDSDIWCLVTYQKHSGWVMRNSIERK